MATQTMTTQNIFAPKTNSISTSNPTPPAQRIRAYKDFLTPSLHRRFTHAAGIVLLFCWLDSALLSNYGWFSIWTWLPLSAMGLRALMLFIPCLAVFIVRVANMHISAKTSPSAFSRVWMQLASVKGLANTLHTVAWYCISAFLFGEIYIWTRKETAELAIVDMGREYERPRMNENPIFLRSLFVVVGLVQVGVHLVLDFDKVDLPATEDEKAAHNIPVVLFGFSLEKASRPLQILAGKSTNIGKAALNNTIVGNIVNLIVYYAVLRRTLWYSLYSLVRPFFSLPPSSPPTGILHFWKILGQALFAPMMLVALWEISNSAFEAYVGEPPLKKGEPLTSEIKDARGVILHKSKDPNGSLLTGLRGKKEVTKAFAFWELALICDKFEKRRKTIYTEVDRKDGSTWSKVCEYALKEIEDINARIKAAREPVDYKSAQQQYALQRQGATDLVAYDPAEQRGLKKIADRTVKDDADLFAKPKPDLFNVVGNMAKSIGQRPGEQDPFSPRARQALKWGADKVLTPEEQQYLNAERLHQEANGWFAYLLSNPVGQPFRHTFARKVNAVIFGSPSSNRVNIIHAAFALTKLCVNSLKEDDYGQVQKDVARIVRTFTDTIRDIETFVKELKPDWTDVYFAEQDRNVKEVQELLDVLKGGLQEIMLAFAEYAPALGLSKKEVREATEAAARSKSKTLPPLPPPKEKERIEMREMEPGPVGTRQRKVYN